MKIINYRFRYHNHQIKNNFLIFNFKNFYSINNFKIISSALKFIENQNIKILYNYNDVSLFLYAIQMTDILLNIEADEESISAAILYKLYHFRYVSDENIKNLINQTVLKILQGTSDISNIKIYYCNNIFLEKVDILKKIFLTLFDDVRIILIKIVNILCTIRYSSLLSVSMKIIISREILNIYAPLANRLGLNSIKWELEDRAFFFLYNNDYKKIAESLVGTRKDREYFLLNVIKDLKIILKKYNLFLNIQGRVKHLYSIYKKFKNKGYKDLSNLYDIFAIRIITNNIDDCYMILDKINNFYATIPEEFCDYILNPKLNGYKSIHLVIKVGQYNIEIQIRTKQMHEESELGFAAHWRYKEGLTFDTILV